jgi:hypothetical protein
MGLIQRNIKNFLYYRRKLYKEVIKKWNVCEIIVFGGGKSYDNKKNRRRSILAANTSTIPKDIKEKYIRKQIKEFLWNYKVQYRNYCIVKNLYDDGIHNFRRQESVVLEYNPIKPLPPKLIDLFTQEILISLIHQSVRDRCAWKKPNLT